MPNKLMNEQKQKARLPYLSTTQSLETMGAGAADSGADSPLIQAQPDPNEAENQPHRSQLRDAVKAASNPRTAETSRLSQSTEQLIQQAQQLAHKGDKESKEQAVQLLSQAVALSPADSDAWMWLGGLLLDQNLERAQFCLERAIELNPQNERARRGLTSVTSRMVAQTTQPELQIEVPLFADVPPVAAPETAQSTALAIVPAQMETENSGTDTETTGEISTVQAQNQAELGIVPLDTENQSLSEIAPDRNTKIGLEEAVAVLREAGYDADPATVPTGGAKIREGLASGTLIAGRKGIREARFYGLRLTITLLGVMALLAAFGIYLLIAQPDFKQILADKTTPTPVPTATPLPDARAATKLQISFGNYNRYFTTFQNLTNQAINGKLEWSDFHNQFADLNNKIKTESQNVNAAATSVTPQLLETFKELQDVAATANTAADYTMSGIENETPEDLQAGIRYFNQATSLLSDAARKLEQVAPLATATQPPLPTTPLVTSTENGLLTPTPLASPNPTIGSVTPALVTPH